MLKPILTAFVVASSSALLLAQPTPPTTFELGDFELGGPINWTPPVASDPNNPSDTWLEPIDPWAGFRVSATPGWWVVLLFHGHSTSPEIVSTYSFADVSGTKAKTELTSYLAARSDGLSLDLTDIDANLDLAVTPEVLHAAMDSLFPPGETPLEEERWSQPITVPTGTTPVPTANSAWAMTWVGAPPEQTSGASAYLDTWQPAHTTVTDGGNVDLFSLDGMLDIAVGQQNPNGPSLLSDTHMEVGLANGVLYLNVQAFAFRAVSSYGSSTATTPDLTKTGSTKVRVTDRKKIKVPASPATRGRAIVHEPPGNEIWGGAGQVIPLTVSPVTENTTIRFQTLTGFKDQPVVKVGPRSVIVRVPTNVSDNFFVTVQNSFGLLDGATMPPAYGPMLFRRL